MSKLILLVGLLFVGQAQAFSFKALIQVDLEKCKIGHPIFYCEPATQSMESIEVKLTKSFPDFQYVGNWQKEVERDGLKYTAQLVVRMHTHHNGEIVKMHATIGKSNVLIDLGADGSFTQFKLLANSVEQEEYKYTPYIRLQPMDRLETKPPVENLQTDNLQIPAESL